MPKNKILMKKREIKPRIIFCFILVSIILISGLGFLTYGKNSAEISAQVINEIENHGKAKVIVVMKDTGLLEKLGGMSSQALREEEINSIGEEKVKHKFESFNGFSAGISGEDLEKLAGSERVERIEYDTPVQAFLSSSVPLINATTTWPIVIDGLNITGEGETICIIDTGVNYTHPDLGGCLITNLSLSGNNITLDTPIESDHNYTDDYDNTWAINYTGFVNISIHFANISTENHYDHVVIYDKQNRTIATYTGTKRDFWTPTGEGDTIYVRLVSDSSVTGYGFYIDKLLNGTSNMTYNWGNCTKVIGGWDIYNSDPNPMDDGTGDAESHGTHCTGIAAANGAVSGVAKGSKIIGIKALSSGGSGSSSEVIRGIEWCTANSEKYNISVISMSLGADCSTYPSLCYSAYCDSAQTAYKSAIDNATAKNISVIIATGNDGNKTAISVPACIQNAVAVGASDKSDVIASYSNRNSITDLFAPGSTINSTIKNGGYASYSGTSMSTPHVAGAFALVRQFYRQQTGNILTTAEIQDALNRTGKLIDDSAGSGLNFSRIDIYSAILSLPGVIITVHSPQNSRTYNATSLLINFSATNLGDVSVLWYYNETTNITTSTNYTNVTEGQHTFAFYANDSSGNLSKTRVSFWASLDTPTINFTSPTIEPGSYSQTAIWANVTANDSTSFTLRIFLYNSSGLVNSSNSSAGAGSLFANFTGLADGTYYLNATANDSVGNINQTETKTISIDTLPPAITIVTPANKSWYGGLSFNVSINEAGSCWAEFNGTNITMTNTTSAMTYFFYLNTSIGETSTNSTYNVTFYCNDSSGKINSSGVVFFGVDITGPTISFSTPTTTSSGATFYYTVSDTNSISKCDLIVDGSVAWTDNSVTRDVQDEYFLSLSAGSHTGRVNCTDIVGNVGSSSQRSFTITSSTTTSSTSSITTTTAPLSYNGVIYSLSDTAIKSGTTKLLKGKDKLTFSISNKSHTLTILNVTAIIAKIKVESEPVTLEMKILEEKKLDLNLDGYFDFYVKLNGITSLVANLTVKEIYEKQNITIVLPSNETLATNETIVNKTKWEWGKMFKTGFLSKLTWKAYLYIGIPVVVIGGGIIAFILYKKYLKKKRYYEKGY